MSETSPQDSRILKYQLPLEPAAARAVRKRAKARLADALDGVLAPAGYVHQKTGSLWIQQGLLAKTYVEIQSSTSGFECFINLGREDPSSEKIPSYANGTFWRLAKVAPEASAVRNYDHGDSLSYVALSQDPALAPAVAVLVRDKALPFLQRFHVPSAEVKSGAPKRVLGRMLGWLSKPPPKDPNSS